MATSTFLVEELKWCYGATNFGLTLTLAPNDIIATSFVNKHEMMQENFFFSKNVQIERIPTGKQSNDYVHFAWYLRQIPNILIFWGICSHYQVYQPLSYHRVHKVYYLTDLTQITHIHSQVDLDFHLSNCNSL